LALSTMIFLPRAVTGAHYAGQAAGYILLQVESKGEAW